MNDGIRIRQLHFLLHIKDFQKLGTFMHNDVVERYISNARTVRFISSHSEAWLSAFTCASDWSDPKPVKFNAAKTQTYLFLTTLKYFTSNLTYFLTVGSFMSRPNWLIFSRRCDGILHRNITVVHIVLSINSIVHRVLLAFWNGSAPPSLSVEVHCKASREAYL